MRQSDSWDRERSHDTDTNTSSAYAESENDFSPNDFISDEWIGKIYTDPKKLSLSVKKVCFHNVDHRGNATGVNDKRIYTYITHTQHIVICGGIAYIYRHGYYNEDLDGTILQSLIGDCMLEQYEKSSTITRVHRMFFQRNELVKPPEEMNHYSGYYINFNNCMFDVKTWKTYPHSHRTFSTNQIPHDYDPNGDHGSGIEIEKFLNFAVPEADDREMLLQYIGLCLTHDVSQQKMLVIRGEGGTGKSTLINLIQDMVGYRNISNVSLTELQQRFKPILLMGKLLNTCADLEIDALDDVSMVKKLIGEDYVDGEHKGLRPVSFKNYAKLLFSTNELPLVRNEKTKGFYRRLLVLEMNREPEHADHDLKKRLTAELPYLIHISMQALHRMYQTGQITVSENSKRLTHQLRMDSDSVEAFLSDCCRFSSDDNDRVSRSVIFEKYIDYCKEYERQAHTKKNFFTALRNKKIKEVKGASERYFCGVSLKDPSVDDDGFMVVPQIDPDIPFNE